MMPEAIEWHRVAAVGDVPEGRVVTVTAGSYSVALTRLGDRFGCLDNRCPHQGGPLGEGTIEDGWLRCPWHGYDYDPVDGTPPPGFEDSATCFPVEVRDGEVFVGLPVVADEPVRTVSDVMVETMVAWGVDSVFGMVGHSNLGLADAIRRAEERGELAYFGVRHEGAAAFAASAYGKLTGRPAACLAIAGPGSTNLLTGLYDARMDGAPVLALSGQVPSKTRGRGAFQDADLRAAFGDVAAYSQTVQAGSDHAELMTLACKAAVVERGVAHLVFPDDVQTMPMPDTPAGGPGGRLGAQATPPREDDLKRAVDLIRSSKRPMIIVGNGAFGGRDRVIELAERLGAPIATTFKAKGLVPDSHPLACGVLGRSGTPVASWFMNESDLLIVLGASFANHTGIAPHKPTIQVDIAPAALGRFHPVDLPLLGDVGTTVGGMVDSLVGERGWIDRRPEVALRWAMWRTEKESRAGDDRGNGLPSAAVFDALTRCVPADAVIAVDVGNNTYAFGRYFESRGQPVLMSGYLGSIGFALPAALGAWAAVRGDRPVVSISGDGGLGQYAMELTTAARYGMNITHVVLDDSELGKISKEQRAAHFDVWQTGLLNPDFAAFAELCGARGFTVDALDELIPAVEAALAHDGPALVRVVTDPLLV